MPSKAAAPLAGRALISYPTDTLASVCGRVAVVCKRDTPLPRDLASAERWNEPDEPRHPLTGIVHALERARRPVLVCAADMPFVTTVACRELVAAARADEGQAEPKHPWPRSETCLAAVATAGRRDAPLEPLFAVYTPAALAVLRTAPAGAPLRTTIEALDPRRIALPAGALRSVNTPEELAAAARELGTVVA